MKRTVLVVTVLLILVGIFSFASAEGNESDCVRGFSLNGGTANFTVFAEDDCRLVLRVYDGTSESKLPEGASPELVGTVRTDVACDDSSEGVPVSVSLPASTPEYFYLEWYLESASGTALTETYFSSRYCEDIARIADMTDEQLAGEYSNLVTWPSASGTYAYSEAGEYAVSESDGSGTNFVALRENVLAVGTGRADALYSDFSLSEDGRTLTLTADELLITGIEGLSYEYVFYEENGSFGANKIEDILVSKDRRTVSLTLSDETAELQDYGLAARVVGTVSQSKPFPIDMTFGAVKITGTLNSDVGGKFYYNWSPVYPVLDIKFEYDYTIDDFTVTFTEAVSLNKTIVPIPIFEILPGVGFNCDLRFVLDADVSGSVSFKISGTMGAAMGLNGWKNSYGNDLNDGPHITMSDFDIQGEVFTGFAIGPQFAIGKLLGIGGEVKVGPLFKAGKNQTGYVNDSKAYHACKNGECWGGTARFRFGIDLSYTALFESHVIVGKNWDTDPWAM